MTGSTTPGTARRPGAALLTDDLHQNPLPAPAVEFAVEDQVAVARSEQVTGNGEAAANVAPVSGNHGW